MGFLGAMKITGNLNREFFAELMKMVPAGRTPPLHQEQQTDITESPKKNVCSPIIYLYIYFTFIFIFIFEVQFVCFIFTAAAAWNRSHYHSEINLKLLRLCVIDRSETF